MKTLLKFVSIFLLLNIFLTSCVKEVEKVVEKVVYKEPTDSSGCTSNDSITLCYVKTSPCGISGEEFTFTASGLATETGVEKYEWYFGDNTSAIGNYKRIQHIYTSANNYTVLLKIFKNGVYQIKSINVNAYANAGIVNITKEFNSVNIIGKTATYRFSGWVTKYVSSYTYKWDFGDGTTSNDSITNHSYELKSTEQKVNVVFTVTSKAGCQTSETFEILLPAAYNIKDTISYTVTDPCKGNEEFTFIGPTLNIPNRAQYLWDFKDGQTSNVNFAKHKYANPNTFPVVLRIVFNNRDIFNSTIIVKPKGQDAVPPAELKLCCNYLSTTHQKWFFQNNSSGNAGGSIINWKCNFGDGSAVLSGKVDSYKHEYERLNNDTTYKIKMEVTGESGCTNLDSTYIFVPKL